MIRPDTGREECMGISHQFVGNVALFSAEGELSNRDIRQALEEATRDPSFRKGMRILMHDLGSTYKPSAPEAYEAAKDLSELTRHYSPHVAVVVQAPKYGLGKMIAAFCEREGIDFQVFRSVENARQWLQYVD
jgi:DNA polymerase III alpha subunit